MRRYTKKMGIKKKLQVNFTIIFIILTGMICLFWYKAMSDMAREKAISRLSSSIDTISSELDNIQKDASYISLILSFSAEEESHILTGGLLIEDYRQLEGERSLTKTVSDFYSYRNYISSILLRGINGKVFSNGMPQSKLDLTDQPWFDKILEDQGNGVFIGTHTNDGESGRNKNYVVSAARRLMSSGQTIGYVVVDISYEYMVKRFANMVEKGSTVLIVDEDGGIVYNSREPELPGGKLCETELGETADLLERQSGSFRKKIGGKDTMVLYRRSGFSGWSTVCLMPMGVIVQDIIGTLRIILTISLCLLLAGVFLIGYFSTYMTKHIMSLKRYVDRTGGENRLETIPVIASGDEVEELGNSFNQMIKRIRQLMEDLEIRKQKEKNAEFQALYAQISPHFLSNTLNTIHWMAERQKADNISELTRSLITLLQYSMNNKKEIVTVEEELDYIRNYLVIQEYRYYGLFDVSFQIGEGLKRCRILKFMIQPLVENSIMHGLAKLDRPGRILISVKKEGERLVIMVADNGAGFSVDAYEKQKTHHIGIENIRQRISLFYGEEYSLTIKSKKDCYTCVKMELPLCFEKGEDYAKPDDCG